MKIPVQEKIAELERRIVALELAHRVQRRVVEQTTTQPLTTTQEGHLRSMWAHFDAMFSEFGKIFR